MGRSGVSCVPTTEFETARHAWGPLQWETIRLRVGPNYRRNKQKAFTGAPILPCVGMDFFQAERKAYAEDGRSISYMPPEIVAAASEPSGCDLTTPMQQPVLPRFVVISTYVPQYSSSASDGPNCTFIMYLRVPVDLREQADPAVKMLCDFLDGAYTGHRDPGGEFFDRFKVIARLRHIDHKPNWFVRTMIDSFNAKPMLWRFFGVWGQCRREGRVVFIDCDMCTGGRLKNSAFFEGQRSGIGHVTDLSWTLEARTDEEMPERLLGGATLVRPDCLGASPLPADTHLPAAVFEHAESSGPFCSLASSPSVAPDRTASPSPEAVGMRLVYARPTTTRSAMHIEVGVDEIIAVSDASSPASSSADSNCGQSPAARDPRNSPQT